MELISLIPKLFLIILPGTVGMLIIKSLNVHKDEHYYLEFIKVFSLSFFSFLITDLIVKFFKIHFAINYKTVDIVKSINDGEFTIKTSNEILAIIVAVILAFIFTKCKYNNTLFKIANKFNITGRVDNQTVWEHIFDSNAIVVIRDKITSNTYYGRVEKFSDNCDNREILLKEVKVFDDESNFLYECKSLYFSRMHNEFEIETYDYNNEKKV